MESLQGAKQVVEPTTVGLSSDGHAKLKMLKDEGYFREMAGAYRFAVAYALAHGQISDRVKAETIFNVHTLDPDRSLYWAIKALYKDSDESIYSIAEQLAEWGVQSLATMADAGEIRFVEILEEAASLLTVRSI